MRRFTTAAAIAVVAALVALVAAFPAGASHTKKLAGKPIVFAAPISMTGALQPYGLWPEQMAQFAVDDINKSGGLLGRPVKLVAADDKSDPAANGAAAALDTIGKGASVLFSNCDFDFGAPAQTVAIQKGIPAVSWCAGAPRFGPHGLSPLSFSAGIATPNEAAVPAEWMYQVKHWRSAYILDDTTISYDTTFCSYFQKRWKQLGGTIAGSDTFHNSDASIAPQITRFRAVKAKPSFIMLCSYTPGGASAMRQIRAAGISTPIFMNIGMGGNYWLKSVPNLGEAYQTSYASYVGDDPIAKVNELSKRWQAKYHQPVPIPHAYMGYVAVQIVAAAIKKAHSTDGKAIAKALSEEKNVPTIIGPFTMDPTYNHCFSYSVTIMAFKNGNFHFVTRRKPEIRTESLL